MARCCAAAMRAFAAHSCTRRKADRLGNGKHMARCNRARLHAVPTAQILNRDAKTIGNSDERVTAAHRVTCRPDWSCRGNGNNQLVAFINTLARSNAVGLSDLARARVQLT